MNALSILSVFLFTQLAAFLSVCTRQESTTAINPVAALYSKTVLDSNVKYAEVDSTSLYLDVYYPAKRLGEAPYIEISTEYKPTLLYFHGGGWSEGDRISRSLELLPYVEKGWCVVTADYRLLGPTNLMDCIQDCRLALNWVYEQASKYKFDTTCIVVSGESAGGHLALMTGIANTPLYATDSIPTNRTLKVAAIVNWFGITDVEKAINFWNNEAYTQQIVGKYADKDQIF